jgi:nicotinamidase-related amidase
MPKTALLIIDLINDLVNQESHYATCAKMVLVHKTIAIVNKAIYHAREQAILPVFIKVGFSSGYPELPRESPVFTKAKDNNALQFATWGTEFHPELAYQQNDIIVHKSRVSPFYATSLEAILRANAIKQLVLCGVSTDMAINLTARESHDRDYQTIVLADACASAQQEWHDMSLTLLARIARVQNCADWLQRH